MKPFPTKQFTKALAVCSIFVFAFVSTLIADTNANVTVEADRIYRDFDFDGKAAAGEASALSVKLSAPLPREKVRAVTLHLKSGSGWYSADLGKANDAFCAAEPIRLPLGAFTPEGDPDPIFKAKTLRVSVWKHDDFTVSIELGSASFAPPANVAVVRATDRTAPGETWFAGSMADRCARLLEKAAIPFDFTSDDFASLDSGTYRLVFLPYSPKISEKDHVALRKISKRGTKFVVFYNGSEAIGRILGVTLGPWMESGKVAFSAIDAGDFPLAPRRIPHYTLCAIPPHPASGGQAKTIASWIRGNRGSGKIPAVTLSPTGACFAHVPPRAYPAAVDFVYAISSNLLAASGAKVPARPDRPAPASKISSLLTNGVPVAAWIDSAQFPFGDRDDTLRELGELGLTTLFAHVNASTGNAYALAVADDIFGKTAKIGRENGISLHAWVTCFSLDGISQGEIARMQDAKRVLPSNPLWLNPALPENQDEVIRRLVEIASKGVAGINLDYVRTDDSTPQSDETAEAVTKFVRKASQALRAVNSNIVISASVYPTPRAARNRNQNWPEWVGEGIVDFVTPMIYAESPAEFKVALAECVSASSADKIVPGIGTGADESQTDAATTIEEIRLAAEASCRGIAFFTLNDSLLDILREIH